MIYSPIDLDEHSVGAIEGALCLPAGPWIPFEGNWESGSVRVFRANCNRKGLISGYTCCYTGARFRYINIAFTSGLGVI